MFVWLSARANISIYVSLKFCCQFNIIKVAFLCFNVFILSMELSRLLMFVSHMYFFCELSKKIFAKLSVGVLEFCLFSLKAFSIFQHVPYFCRYVHVHACRGVCVCVHLHVTIFCSSLGKLVS